MQLSEIPSLDCLLISIILIFIKIGKIIPSKRITESEKKARIPSMLGNINEIVKTIMTGSIENSLQWYSDCYLSIVSKMIYLIEGLNIGIDKTTRIKKAIKVNNIIYLCHFSVTLLRAYLQSISSSSNLPKEIQATILIIKFTTKTTTLDILLTLVSLLILGF